MDTGDYDEVAMAPAKPPTRKSPSPASPLITDEDRPITLIQSFEDMGAAVAVIKRQGEHLGYALEHLTDTVREVRDDVKGTLSDVTTLKVKVDTLQSEVSSLKVRGDRPHDCHQVGAISALSDATRGIQQKIDECHTKVAGVESAAIVVANDLKTMTKEKDKTGNRFFSVFVAIIGLALTSIGGWVYSIATVKADVQYLQRSQDRMMGDLEKTRATAMTIDARTEKQSKAIERVGNHNYDAGVCSSLTDQERDRVISALGRDPCVDGGVKR